MSIGINASELNYKMAKITIEWHSMQDIKVCPICEALNGYIWTFQTGENEFGTYLTHHQFGLVWVINQGSMAHGHVDTASCRCRMTHELSFSDTLKKVEALREKVVAGLRYVK